MMGVRDCTKRGSRLNPEHCSVSGLGVEVNGSAVEGDGGHRRAESGSIC